MIEIHTFAEQYKKIQNQETHEEKLVTLLETYIELFPVKNAYLLRYSPIGFLGEGVVKVEAGKIYYIHEERYDVRTVPAIMTAISEKRANFVRGKELFKITSSHHVLSTEIQAFLATPILKRGNVIGFIYSNQFEDEDAIPDLLEQITEFSLSAGEIIIETEQQDILSKRELEVMRKIANGFSTKEIAAQLNISELTVKQYVQSARVKLNANNRAHAIAQMCRLGIL